jgi:hypothetical protein
MAHLAKSQITATASFDDAVNSCFRGDLNEVDQNLYSFGSVDAYGRDRPFSDRGDVGGCATLSS